MSERNTDEECKGIFWSNEDYENRECTFNVQIPENLIELNCCVYDENDENESLITSLLLNREQATWLIEELRDACLDLDEEEVD